MKATDLFLLGGVGLLGYVGYTIYQQYQTNQTLNNPAMLAALVNPQGARTTAFGSWLQ